MSAGGAVYGNGGWGGASARTTLFPQLHVPVRGLSIPVVSEILVRLPEILELHTVQGRRDTFCKFEYLYHRPVSYPRKQTLAVLIAYPYVHAVFFYRWRRFVLPGPLLSFLQCKWRNAADK